MGKSKENPPFVGPVAEAFILGAMRGSLTGSVSILSLKEMVLLQYGNHELFGQIYSAANRLVKREVITFNDGEVKPAV